MMQAGIDGCPRYCHQGDTSTKKITPFHPAHRRPSCSVLSELPPLKRKVERKMNARTSTGAEVQKGGGGSTPLGCWARPVI